MLLKGGFNRDIQKEEKTFQCLLTLNPKLLKGESAFQVHLNLFPVKNNVFMRQCS